MYSELIRFMTSSKEAFSGEQGKASLTPAGSKLVADHLILEYSVVPNGCYSPAFVLWLHIAMKTFTSRQEFECMSHNVLIGDALLELAPHLLQCAQTFLNSSPKQSLCYRGTMFSCSFHLCAGSILFATGC